MTLNYLAYSNWLTPTQNSQLLQYAIANQDEFSPSVVATNDATWRKSWVLYDTEQWGDLFEEQILVTFGEICNKLDIPVFNIDLIEKQITRHGNSNFYKKHSDSKSKEVRSRKISYVYYFNTEPKQFTGGELVIYNEKDEVIDTFSPTNNTCVFFNSDLEHEVQPVVMKKEHIQHCRYTLNGWIRCQN